MASARVSTRLLEAIWRARQEGTRQYQISRSADLHPSITSAIVRGMIPIRPGDPRVIRLGQALGLDASECFEDARV